MARRKSKYNIDAEWDDPYERKGDRRSAERCPESFKIKIGLKVADHDRLLVGAGLVQNISQEGMLCQTKHELEVGQEVHLAISTKEYSSNNDFPSKFVGTGRVNRVTPIGDTVIEIGIVFGSDLSGDMSFSLFIETLQSIASLKSTLK